MIIPYFRTNTIVCHQFHFSYPFSVVSIWKTLFQKTPVRPEPIYTYFPLVSPLKQTEDDGFNLGEDNCIKDIYIKNGALRFEISAVLRPGRFLGNHYLAFTVPNRTFIITMDRVKEGIRAARRNKRMKQNAMKEKQSSQPSSDKKSGDIFSPFLSEKIISSLNEKFSFRERPNILGNQGKDISPEQPKKSKPNFFVKFVEGYLEASSGAEYKEETQDERKERLTTAMTQVLGSSNVDEEGKI